MEFGVIGVSYKNADLEIREKVSFTDTKKMEFFQILKEKGVEQSIILSTCNRSEVYFLIEREEERLKVKKAYLAFFPSFLKETYLFEKQGEEALVYLYHVAAGLESLVLGEDQILGQTVEALEFAKKMGFAKKEMNKIFRDAITCAKKIKTEFKISEHPLSVVYIGLKKLNQEYPLSEKRILVIGSGNMAALSIPYLIEFGAREIFLCSRLTEHANMLKERYPVIQIGTFEERYSVMEQCDVIISATSAPHIVIDREKVKPVQRVRYLLDLATPRDIDPELGGDPKFVLFDLDSFRQIAVENQKLREKLVSECKRQIDAEVKDTLEWLKISRIDIAIESLQNRCNEITKDTFSYLNRKIELNEREKGILKKTLYASLQKLICEPVQMLKRLENEEEQDDYIEMIQRLFGV